MVIYRKMSCDSLTKKNCIVMGQAALAFFARCGAFLSNVRKNCGSLEDPKYTTGASYRVQTRNSMSNPHWNPSASPHLTHSQPHYSLYVVIFLDMLHIPTISPYITRSGPWTAPGPRALRYGPLRALTGLYGLTPTSGPPSGPTGYGPTGPRAHEPTGLRAHGLIRAHGL